MTTPTPSPSPQTPRASIRLTREIGPLLAERGATGEGEPE